MVTVRRINKTASWGTPSPDAIPNKRRGRQHRTNTDTDTTPTNNDKPSVVSGIKTTDVVLILDRSGSMFGRNGEIADATIANFNEYVETIRANADKGGQTLISFLSFNHKVTTHFWRQSPDQVVPLTRKTFVPEGNTAWCDAMGEAIDYCERLEDANDPEHAFLICNFTDGLENSSRRESYSSIGTKVVRTQATNRYTYAVIGANIDLTQLAALTHIPVGNTYRHRQSVTGIRASSAVGQSATSNYFSARAQGLSTSDNFVGFVTGGKLSDDADASGDPLSGLNTTSGTVNLPVSGSGAPGIQTGSVTAPHPVPPPTPRSAPSASNRTGAPSPLLGDE